MRVRAWVSVVAAAVVLAGCGSSPEENDAAEISLTAAPEISSWSSLNGILIPIGVADGPRSGIWEPLTGFSRTPQGAALAAIGQSVQLSTASDSSWSKVLPVVAAAGEGRDAFAVNRALITATGSIDPAVAPTILGYRFDSYSDTNAAVDVVQRFPDDSLASTRTNVVWVETDWKLDLPTPGNAVGAKELTELPSDMVDLEGTRK